MNFCIFLLTHSYYFHSKWIVGFCFLLILCGMHHKQCALSQIYSVHHLIKISSLKNFKIYFLLLSLNYLIKSFFLMCSQNFKQLYQHFLNLRLLFNNPRLKQSLDQKENHLFVLSLIHLEICFHSFRFVVSFLHYSWLMIGIYLTIPLNPYYF